MKPLTIEELKRLEADDWVWFVLTEEGQKEALNRRRDISHMYLIVYSVSEKGMELGAIMYSSFVYLFKDYGKTWLAYKNKEQEEGKETQAVKDFAGNIIELLDEMGMERSSEYNDGYDDGVADCITNIKSRLTELYGADE